MHVRWAPIGLPTEKGRKEGRKERRRGAGGEPNFSYTFGVEQYVFQVGCVKLQPPGRVMRTFVIPLVGRDRRDLLLAAGLIGIETSIKAAAEAAVVAGRKNRNLHT